MSDNNPKKNFTGNLGDKQNGTKNLSGNVSDKQAVRKKLSKEFDHEFANEPLTEVEKLNNKKTKKRQ